MTLCDRNGQPFNLRFNRARRTERDISEMLGLAKGVLADGKVTEAEAALLRDWVATHPDATDGWPGNVVADRLFRIFEDGLVEEEERSDLADLLQRLVGGGAGLIAKDQASSDLPLDVPPPSLFFPSTVFVFTGRFAFGPRRECEREVQQLGGICESGVTMRTDVLVIGTFGSRDWVHTSYGRKIQKALTYRQSGVPIAIVSEDHWASAIP